jgi:hypothetical protein
MANRLEKIPQIGGSGGGNSGGGGGDDEDPKKPALPPQGSPCYEDLLSKVQTLWPQHIVTHVKPDQGKDYLRVSSAFTGYVWGVTGECIGGYIRIRYWVIQSPGGFGSA